MPPTNREDRLRRERAPEVLAAIRARCEAIAIDEPPCTDLAKAASYVLDQWRALTRFVDAGFLPLDNNPVERDLRTVAVGRKNWLFVGSEDGGAWATANFTVFQSCRTLGIDALGYLVDVMPVLLSGGADPLTLTPSAWLRGELRRSA